jgi:hypothetical protein
MHRRGSGGGCNQHRIARPDQDSACLIGREVLGVNEFLFESFEGVVIQLELDLERSIRHPLTPLEEGNHLIEDSVKVHERPSTCLPGSAQVASDPWEPCLRSQAPARNAVRHKPYSEKHTMTRAKAYQKRQAKARQRRRRNAQERLARDRRQA